ncbi:MAG: hypothetical protein P4L53_06180 [Candidatus Obscuribacterales bacterium]|nr:hypothetical protein [Candidatus Obscuribacterales bacterium]
MADTTPVVDNVKKPNDAVTPKTPAPDASAKLVDQAHDLMKQTPAAATGADHPQSTAKAAAVAEAPKPSDAAPAKSWLDIPGDLYSSFTTNKVATLVEKGWDTLSDSVASTYKSIMADSSNKTTHVDAKMGADGKPDYFQSQDINGKKELSADQVRLTDAKGGTIVKNIKTGEITSQSADGEDVYTRKPDGTEIYRSKNIEYSKTKDGKYQVRDEKGDVTDVTSQGAITKIDGQFKIAQRITTIDATAAKPEVGQLETMTDGQRYMDKAGNVVVARQDGVREVTTKDGHHFRIDREHHKVEIEQNGSWRELNKNELEKFHQCHEREEANGRKHFQFNGVDIDANGKVNTADKVTLGEATPGGKMVAHVPTTDGQSAVVTNNPDHTSDLALHGHITHVNPDDPTHLVQRFAENPDGSQGASEFNYNSVDNSFDTKDLQWDQDGTHLGWNDCNVDGDGNVSYANGQSAFADDDAEQIQSSAVVTQQSCMEASSAVSDVAGKLGSQSVDAGDLGTLSAAAGDLDAALANAMSCENFGAAVAITQAKASVYAAIEAVTKQLAVKEQEDMKKQASANAPALSFLPDLTYG